MGGEPASTARRRLAGVARCICKGTLPPPELGERPGERYCANCEPRRHKVSMRYELVCGVWRVTLSDGGRELKSLKFTDGFKVEEMAERGRPLKDLQSRQGIESGIRNGLGRCDLHLTDRQYQEAPMKVGAQCYSKS